VIPYLSMLWVVGLLLLLTVILAECFGVGGEAAADRIPGRLAC